MEIKTCCFIGHRDVANKEVVYDRVKKVIENLIVNENVRVFHFGSRSEFDDICHEIITDFQEEYPDIKRINYNRKSEYVVKKEEKKRLEEQWSKVLHEQVSLKDFEGEKMSERVARAGKASYVERNKEMIDDSEYCVFYYKEDYKPDVRKSHYPSSGKSGTKIAFDYATSKSKEIINVADEGG